MYFDNVDSLDGQGAFIQKFGLMMEQSASLTVARRRWEQLVGRFGQTIIPSRPNEGDLLYFPMTKKLFEIKFVQHEDPFYQLGKLYVYKLQVELFQYSSEFIDTGNAEIDAFETLKTYNVNPSRSANGEVVTLTITNGGTGYTSAPTVEFVSTSGINAAATATINSDGEVESVTITNGGTGYKTNPTVNLTGGGGTGAAVTAAIGVVSIDSVENYPDNSEFGDEAGDVLFDVTNPFGEIE
jgi:hypothetical protein